MKPLRWYVNAAARTLRSIHRDLASPDDAFARRHLPDAEFELYMRMDPRDREHVVAVARRLIEAGPDAPPHLVRAALLHDVGKSLHPFRVWERIAAHLYAPTDVAAQPARSGVRRAWQVRTHHALYGARMLRDAGSDPRVVALVARHHESPETEDEHRLRRADEVT